MSKLLRYETSGSPCFITSVTSHRERFLKDSYDLLVASITEASRDTRSVVIAYAILPDHFHAVIEPKQANVSSIVKRIKLKFSYKYREKHGLYRMTLWQPRFWDHIIRDQNDLNRHIDYIHYNAVKHGYVESPYDWVHTSLHRYRQEGYYSDDWGSAVSLDLKVGAGE